MNREVTKSTKLSSVHYDVRGPVLDEALKMEAAGTKILKLNIGNPGAFGMTAPGFVMENITRSLEPASAYSDSKGIMEAREAIALYTRKKGTPGVTADDVYTGNGLSELIVMCMQALLNDGDEILIPSPDYPLWTAAAIISGGTPVHYICDEQSDWMPDIEDMRRKITPYTRAIVVINPNNPTGALYSREILEQIAQLARENNLIIFSDEVYDRLVMDGHEHIATATAAPDIFVVTLNGLSKSHLACGYRCGWMSLSGDKARAKSYIEGLNMLASMRLCSNVPAQYGIKPALEDLSLTTPLLNPGGRIFEQRSAVCEVLSEIEGLSFVRPKAAFYVFPKLDVKRFNIKDDEQFVLDFLRAKHILVVRGGGFNWKAPDHFRIVCLPQADVLREAMYKLKDFLSTYRQ